MRHASPARRCLTFCAAIALGILALLPAAHAENAPGVDALRVAKIASDYLATHGRGAPYVVSIVLESDTFGGPKTSWVVRFSRALLTDGNKEVGQGSMEIQESVPPSRIAINLDFLKPFEAHNRVDFTLEPQGEATRVSWSMRGPAPFISKVMHVFINMDNMVRRDFEAGLANLKAVAEK